MTHSCPRGGGGREGRSEGGEELDNSLCHWDGKFDTIKEEWKI